ncbi:hypothetical protein [Flavobacterium sp.]|uniref:hypothetical protein n=1 Tax=Flavobacterium sp. TaxID=239 RepID=UPI00286E2CC1|nr:hypothetical protein [Flavobacterium sp.]
MQKEKNSKEAQGVGTAQEQMNEQFNIATKELLLFIDLDFIQPTYEYLILAWIGSENLDSDTKTERSNIYYFNRTFLRFLSEASKGPENRNLFTEFIDGWDLNNAKERFYEVYDGFLCSDESDDLITRTNGIFLYKELNRYLEKIYEIKDTFQPEFKITA